MKTVEERFLSYVKINTASKMGQINFPSTAEQYELAAILLGELVEMGLEAQLTDNCFVMGKLPSNSSKKLPAVGFIAHLDTSPECSGKDVSPQIIEAYDGGDIVLNKEKNIVLSPSFSPSLLQYKGKRLITTDGTTLLGADDKAGIAEIMSALDYFLAHPEVEHGDICVAFTPDEEVGLGVRYMDVPLFGADFAYTLDSEYIGELQYENFNAASLLLKVRGRNVHPSNGYKKMINALKLIVEFDNCLPAVQTPVDTAGREGFYHLCRIAGSVEAAEAYYVIRDHDRVLFTEKKRYVEQVLGALQMKYPDAAFDFVIEDTYYNMKDKIMPVFEIVEIAIAAMETLGIRPILEPFRGGTDGAMLSYMGLPCPNIFAGWHNAHGKYEYIAVEAMELATKVVIEIVKKIAKG
ncbi:MAG: peptidase T [Culicoidibacterales bacterium]